MANINEILARAAALRDETALNSIDPERAGGIMYDTLMALNELWIQQGAALVISKIYASVAAMNADTSPVSDLTGKPIRPGMIVVIASSDTDNGSVYRYNGTSAPRWSLVGKIGNLEPVDSLDSDSTQLPLAAHQGKVLDGKISQLGQEKVDKDFLLEEFQGKNLINKEAEGVELGHLVYKNSSGNLVNVENSSFNTTDYIPVDASTSYVYSTRSIASSDQYGKPRTVTFYDESKAFIDGLNAPNGDNVTTWQTPAGTKYVRLSLYTLSWITGPQLELGTTATTYEPYYHIIQVKEDLIPEDLRRDIHNSKLTLEGESSSQFAFPDGAYSYVKYSDGSVVDRTIAQDYYMIEVPVKKGDCFDYKIYASAVVATIAAYDSNGTYLKAQSLAGIAALDTGNYIVDEGVTTLRFTCDKSAVTSYGCIVVKLENIGLVDKVNDSELLPKDYPFAGVSLSELTLNSSATRNSNGTVSLANGGKAYWDTPTVAVAYTLSAKFVYSSGLSFSIGKDQAGNSGYGGRIVLRDGYIDYYKNSLNDGTYTHTSEATGITLVDGEEYSILVHRQFNYETAARTITVEINGQYNEHFSIELSAGPWYGRPFIQADGASCVVEQFNFDLHLDFDLRNAVIGVWGHSYVEADSLPGTDKLLSFTNLLGNMFGHDKVFNFGWGGDYAQRCLQRIQGESRFTRAIKYALIVIGTNDTSYAVERTTGFMNEMAKYLLEIGINPVFATPNPIPAFDETKNQTLEDISDWIKDSGYKYFDMRQVFIDANGNVRTSLYLADNTHPTVEGHQLIFNRIKMDCPYLF